MKTKVISYPFFFAGTFILCVLFVFTAPSAHAAFTRAPEVRVFQQNTVEKTIVPYDKKFQGGVQIAVGDLEDTGLDDIVTAPGQGGEPNVRVLRADGSEVSHFLAYNRNMRSGINVAVGDLDGDGREEIITAPRQGGAPHVRVFDVNGHQKFTPGFYAFNESFRGGVNIAIGDYNGDGQKEIIVGAGPGGGPQVRIFNRFGHPMDSFFAFDRNFRGGVTVATANVNGGTSTEIVTGVQSQDLSWIKVVNRAGKETTFGMFKAFGDSFKGGVDLSSGDIDGNGVDEIIVGARSGGGPQVRVFNGNGKPYAINFFSYESDFRGGVNVAAGDLTRDGKDEVVTAPASWNADGKTDVPKYIEVSLNEQRLYAYEYGRVVRSFLVSTGLPGYDTHKGTFNIYEKTYSKLYQGPGYYLPNTLWNMRYDGPRFLHGAYWHNDFGRRKSHGCVNIPYSQAQWLYQWAPMGTKVVVRD